MVACSDFLSLEIYDLSKGKRLTKMVIGENTKETLLVFEHVGGGPKELAIELKFLKIGCCWRNRKNAANRNPLLE